MATHWLSEIRRLARGVWSNLSPEKGDMATVHEAARAPRAATSANKHVDEYLSYYVALPHPPKYAVLVNGPWGIGKTYLVIEFLRRAFPVTDDEQRPRPVYVSLYGLSSLSEIDNALLRAMYPLLGYKATKIGGRVTQAPVNLNLTDILDKSGAALYVFDDLERCVADLNSVLGYINQFVEHDDSKVVARARIVIAPVLRGLPPSPHAFGRPRSGVQTGRDRRRPGAPTHLTTKAAIGTCPSSRLANA
jgi:hypothetical protein